jgi:hypothetical protein
MSNQNEQIIQITQSGTSIKRVDQNHLRIDFKNIKSVGVKNIIDVEFHSVNTILNSRSHLIRFRNGGEVAFAYNDTGCLIDLHAVGVDLILSQNDELMFSIRWP